MSDTPEPLSYESAAPPPPKGVLRILFLIVFADLMGFGLIVPLLPFYGKDFGATELGVALLFSVYSLCQLIASPLLGSLSDRHGRRPVLIFSQIGSVAGYVLLGAVSFVSWDPKHLGLALGLVYLSRVIDGFSGGNISAAQAYVSDVTTRENRAKGMGVLGAAFGIGFAVGPAVGGILGHFHPGYPALAAAAFSAIAALLTYAYLPESRVHRPSEAALIFHPSVFAPVFRKTVPRQILLIWFLSMTAFVMLEATFALFLNATFGYGPWQVGWFFAYVGVVIAVVQGGLIGRLTKTVGEWPLTIVGPVLVTVAMAAYVQSAYTPLIALLLVGGFLNATGRSLQGPTLSSLLSKYTDEREQGVAFGLYHGLGSLARVIGPAIAGLVFARHHAGPFVIAGVITVVVAAWTIVLRVQARRTEPEPAPNAQTGPAATGQAIG